MVAREGRLEKPDLCRIVWNSNNGLLAGNLVEMDWMDRLAHPGDVLTQIGVSVLVASGLWRAPLQVGTSATNMNVPASALPGQAMWVMGLSWNVCSERVRFFSITRNAHPRAALG